MYGRARRVSIITGFLLLSFVIGHVGSSFILAGIHGVDSMEPIRNILHNKTSLLELPLFVQSFFFGSTPMTVQAMECTRLMGSGGSNDCVTSDVRCGQHVPPSPGA